MKIINNLSIGAKLFILTLIPLIAVLYFLQENLRNEINNKKIADKIIESVDEVDQISGVLNELQKERALTLAYVSGQSEQFKNQLFSQYENTDKEISNYEKRYKNSLTKDEKYWGSIDSLSYFRSKISGVNSTGELKVYYQNIKTILLEKATAIAQSSQSNEIKNMFNANILLIESKDDLSRIRSRLGGLFLTGKFNTDDYGRFVESKGRYESEIHKFKLESSSDLKLFFESKFEGPFVNRTFLIIDSVYINPSTAIKKYSFDVWWESATSSINILDNIEDYSRYQIKNKASQNLEYANFKLILNSSIAIIIILIIVLITLGTTKAIVNSVNRLKIVADRIAQGEVNIELEVQSKDELGSLAESFKKMISTSKDFSTAAEIIGKGDYTSEVKIRGKEDILGLALNNMKMNLKRLSDENQKRTWLLTGAGELNDTMRGEKDVLQLSQDILILLANYLGSKIGAIFLMNNGTLEMTGSYAYTSRKDNSNSFKMGQGLVGQAALEKKPIVFSEIPDNYIKINSGLGNSTPRNILIYPVIYEGNVNAVIELGSGEDISELQMRFMEMVSENIAIAIDASRSRTQMKELLEETQRQAEELEAQQEELRQSNEELQEKTDLLEKSESELRTQQEELQQSNEELEEKANILEEQKQELEEAKIAVENVAREIEVTSKYKSEFLANMSHELRTPLNSILILAQLLSENKYKTLKEKDIDYAKNIYNSGIDLLNLINEILDLSKVESGNIELEISDIPLIEIREDISSMFSEVAKNKSIDFNMNIAKQITDISISSDRQRLEQILRNILANAFKFTSKGGKVNFEISKSKKNEIYRNQGLKSNSEIISFSITDTGIGIPKSKQAIIFEAFQQADGSTKRKFGGTGLGLSISRQIAEALGGEIHLFSEEDKGSTFTLYLPITFSHELVAESDRKIIISEMRPVPIIEKRINTEMQNTIDIPEDDRNRIGENDKVILIMEDDADFANILLEFVRNRNYKGIIAWQGNSGLSLARDYKPDAILLDMNLPVMDGAEVLTHLKNDPLLRHIPVQVISGFDKRKEGLDLGAFDFIKKPITKDDLINIFDKIEDFVNRKLKKLLIVEDNENQNKAIRELIGNGDVKCFSAYSGKEAFDILVKDNYDSIIVDLGLPDMTGFELLEKIKSNDRLNKIPIIVYTGKDLSKQESSRLNKLANTVVLKTVDSKERLLDETTLFLHRVESQLPKEKQNIIRKLHKTDEILKNKKVLIADDDIRNIYSITNVLEEEGMKCITAENGRDAITTLKAHPDTDIILMDIMMPELDGYETTKEIRNLAEYQKLPIIALTAKAMKGDREKCLNAGMSDYVSKPVNIEQLLSLLRVWLYK